MEFKDKIKKILVQYDISKKEFAEKIGFNLIVLNRNIKSNNITGEFIKCLALKMPEINLNEFLKEEVIDDDHVEFLTLHEPTEDYKTRSQQLIEEIEFKLKELKSIVSRK